MVNKDPFSFGQTGIEGFSLGAFGEFLDFVGNKASQIDFAFGGGEARPEFDFPVRRGVPPPPPPLAGGLAPFPPTNP